MATKLHKPITREVGMVDRKGRGFKVTMEPGDILTFQVKGTRQRHSVYLGHCLAMAQIMSADEEYKRKVATYEARKAAGGRPRRPKKPWLPFSDTYTKVINRKKVN